VPQGSTGCLAIQRAVSPDHARGDRGDQCEVGDQVSGIYNERPESPPYAAVSAVGFSADKTKAMVYVRLRGRGEVRGLELRDGQWLTADKSSGCVWIA